MSKDEALLANWYLPFHFPVCYSTIIRGISTDSIAFIDFLIDLFIHYISLYPFYVFFNTQFDSVYFWLKDCAEVPQTLEEIFFYWPPMHTSPDLCVRFVFVCIPNDRIGVWPTIRFFAIKLINLTKRSSKSDEGFYVEMLKGNILLPLRNIQYIFNIAY